MSATDTSDAEDDLTETDYEMNDEFAFADDLAMEADELHESYNNQPERAKWHEQMKKYRRESERNDPLIDKCCALFPVPTTPAACPQQMVGDNNRVAALDILLQELMRDIDSGSFGV